MNEPGSASLPADCSGFISMRATGYSVACDDRERGHLHMYVCMYVCICYVCEHSCILHCIKVLNDFFGSVDNVYITDS